MTAVFVADIGGTKSKLGVFDLGNEAAGFIAQAVYQNIDFSDFTEVVSRFFIEKQISADFACIAVAGVIEENSVNMTNLSWYIDGNSLKEKFSWSNIFLINDMTALAMGIPQLGEDDIVELKGGVRQPDGTIAVIAPGTGLGQGYLVPHGESYICKCSEGGHSGFAPANEDELELTRWLWQRYGFASAELVSAGPAISTLYQYYREKNEIKGDERIAQKVAAVNDATPVIVGGAIAADPCPLCTQVIHTFISTLGGEAANQALKLYALGGVYIGGGVIGHLHGRVSFEPFIERFLQKEKMRDLLTTIPVYIITNSDVLMLGALRYAKDMHGNH